MLSASEIEGIIGTIQRMFVMSAGAVEHGDWVTYFELDTQIEAALLYLRLQVPDPQTCHQLGGIADSLRIRRQLVIKYVELSVPVVGQA